MEENMFWSAKDAFKHLTRAKEAKGESQRVVSV